VYPSPGPRSLTHAMRSYNVLCSAWLDRVALCRGWLKAEVQRLLTHSVSEPGPRSLTHAMRAYNILPVQTAPRETVSVSKCLYSFITKRDTAVTVSVSNPITVSVSDPITAGASNPIRASVSDPALAAPVARPHALVAPSFIA
jgi:hypothetical protein